MCNFNIVGMKDLDLLLEEKLSLKSSYDDAIKQSEKTHVEEEILNSVIEMSKAEKNIHNTHDIHDIHDIDDNLNSKNEFDLTNHPSIRFIIDMGFTLEEAVIAYTAVGEDPDLMLQYLYSLNMN
jgi:hypothetical protein